MVDSYGRVIDYLRISVTDRCNERCLYCLPEGYKGWAQKADHLTAEEILHVARAAAQMGFRKFRLTGGEPTLRGDLLEIAAGLGALPDREMLGLSTNGLRLDRMAADLRAAGVTSINLSLDAVDPAVYRRITGGDVRAVLRGLDAALAVGFRQVKLNCVLMRHVNEQEIPALLALAADRRVPVRFIELMPLSRTDVLQPENFLSVEEVRDRLAAEGGLETLPDARLGAGPARYFRHRASGAVVGFIGALTAEDFCVTCNKLRLTADGKIRPCLGRHQEMDLLADLRSGRGEVRAALEEAIARKPEDHEFRTCYTPERPMTAIGG
jgi:GTP 3',8-cyclase